MPDTLSMDSEGPPPPGPSGGRRGCPVDPTDAGNQVSEPGMNYFSAILDKSEIPASMDDHPESRRGAPSGAAASIADGGMGVSTPIKTKSFEKYHEGMVNTLR